MQLRVAKCDGSLEIYFHTKVMGSISAALADCSYIEPHLAEDLAEAVTIYIKKRYGCGHVEADEIHSMIKVVLSDTGFENAALCLHEHRINRQMRRNRLEVMSDQVVELADGMDLDGRYTEPWNKSIIINLLEMNRGMSKGLARVVAGRAEELVLSLGCRTITRALVRELVANELLAMQRAERMLMQPIETELAATISA